MGEILNPKVSIVIPVYNGYPYLKYAIDCALDQTYSNVEILVINDGSNDDGKTEEIAMSYGDKIRYFRKENGGVSSALNYGIKEMTGEYFSWLSHDDGYSKTKIEDSVALLNRHNQIGKKTIAYTDGFFVDVNGNRLYSFKKFFDEEHLYQGCEVVKVMTKKGTLNGCSMLIPKSAFEKFKFEETLRYSQDSLMWYNLFLDGFNLISDRKENVTNRIHSMQVTNTRRDLYEHDSLCIAKVLADSLAVAGADVFYSFLSRQLRYQCRPTINYLLHYAEEYKILNRKQKFCLIFSKIRGFTRYRIIKIYKCLLLDFSKKRK